MAAAATGKLKRRQAKREHKSRISCVGGFGFSEGDSSTTDCWLRLALPVALLGVCRPDVLADCHSRHRGRDGDEQCDRHAEGLRCRGREPASDGLPRWSRPSAHQLWHDVVLFMCPFGHNNLPAGSRQDSSESGLPSCRVTDASCVQSGCVALCYGCRWSTMISNDLSFRCCCWRGWMNVALDGCRAASFHSTVRCSSHSTTGGRLSRRRTCAGPPPRTGARIFHSKCTRWTS